MTHHMENYKKNVSGIKYPIMIKDQLWNKKSFEWRKVYRQKIQYSSYLCSQTFEQSICLCHDIASLQKRNK
jgi:hypothetical protein